MSTTNDGISNAMFGSAEFESLPQEAVEATPEETLVEETFFGEETEHFEEGEVLPEPEAITLQKARMEAFIDESNTLFIPTITPMETPMVATRDVSIPRDISDNLSQAASSMADWAEASSNFLSNKKNINKALKAAKVLGNIAAPLSVLSAGLGLIAIFTGEESDTDKILNAIDKLGGKVDQLQNIMLDQFERLENTVKYNSAKVQIDHEMENLRALRDKLIGYQTAIKENNTSRRDFFANEIISDQTDIIRDIKAIQDQVNGTATKINIMDAAYVDSYGNLEVMAALGNQLFSMCILGLTAYTTKKALQSGDNNIANLRTQASIAASIFKPMIQDVRNKWEFWHNKCINEVSSNITKRVNHLLPKLDASSHQTAAKNLRDQLHSYWPWLDFLVAVYNPISGFNNHGYRGWNVNSWFRKSVKNGKSINLIVKWIDKDYSAEARSKGHTTYTTRTVDQDAINREWWLYFVLNKRPLPTKRITHRAENEDSNDVRKLFEKMSYKTPYPGLVFAIRRSQGLYFAWTNSSRVHYVSGSKFTICFFK